MHVDHSGARCRWGKITGKFWPCPLTGKEYMIYIRYVYIHFLDRGFGLRSAHAYILVYDVTSPKVKTIDIDIHLILKHCLFAEFYVPPIPERTNCNFKGTQ